MSDEIRKGRPINRCSKRLRRQGSWLDPRRVFVTGIFLLVGLATASASVRGDAEEANIASIIRAIREFAEHDGGRLPDSLHLLDRSLLSVPTWRPLDTYLYFSYDLPLSGLPPTAPVIVFPTEGGAYVGYLSGKTTFIVGGTSTGNPSEARRSAENWRIAFLGSILLFSITLSVVIQILSKRVAGRTHTSILVVILAVLGAFLLP